MLSWTKLNPTVKLVKTKKKFYNNYLNKIVVMCPGGRIINTSANTSVDDAIQRRIQILESYSHSYMRSFYARIFEFKDTVRAEQITYYRDLLANNTSDIKLRIEEPNISLYSNDENLLYSIAQAMQPDRLLEVHSPASTKEREALIRGEIIVKEIKGYEYKIILRETVIKDIRIKFNLYDHLYNLGDDVKLTKGLQRNLGSTNQYFPGGYFYAKNDQITSFCNLICPDLIAGIYKLVNLNP